MVHPAIAAAVDDRFMEELTQRVLQRLRSKMESGEVEDDVEDVADRLDFAEMQARRESGALLLFSCVILFVGFGLLPAVLCIVRFLARAPTDFRGESYKSGWNYFPSTISEMAADQIFVNAGRCFAVFGLVASVTLLTSAYPWRLRNVYLGGSLRCNQNLIIARHTLPPLGCLTLTGITVTPHMLVTSGNQVITTVVHMSGALAMFGSYLVVEGVTVFRRPDASCRLLRGPAIVMNPKERKLRGLSLIAMLIIGTLFMACNVISRDDSWIADNVGLCCQNTWTLLTEADVKNVLNDAQVRVEHLGKVVEAADALAHGREVLSNTASGLVLVLRICSFMFEVLTGACMTANLFVIWLYCPERHFRLSQDLPGLYDKQDSDHSFTDSRFALAHRTATAYLPSSASSDDES